MKKPFSILCGAMALLCLVSFFMPVIAPKYPASVYHPASGDYTRDYILVGDYYCAREYWSVVKFALSNGYRVAASVAMALLLYWATLSLMGENARITGVIAGTVNLVITIFLIVRMLGVMAACRWGVLILILIDAAAAAVIAWVRLAAGKRKRYITVPVAKKRGR